jgi:signal transduction histidine kinase
VSRCASAWLCAALACLALYAPVRAEADVQWIDTAQLLDLPEVAPPVDATGWRTVPLPDVDMPGSSRASAGSAWYRVRFDGPRAVVASPAWAVYLPYFYAGGQAWLNGVQVGGIPEGDARLQVRWERPHLVALPAGLLRAEGNELLIRAAAGSLGATRYMPRLGIGPQRALQGSYDWRMFWVRTVPQVTVAVCLLTAGFMLFIWWRRRSETLYGLLGVAAALWGVRTLTFVIEQMPVDAWQLWRMVYLGATGGFVVAMALFALRHAGIRRPRIERGLVLYALLGPAWLGVQGRAAESMVNRYWTAGLVPVGIAILAISVWHLMRRRTLAAAVMPAAMIIAVLAGVHDYLIAWDVGRMAQWLPGWAPQRIFLLHHGANLLLLAMGALLTVRFIDALTGLEELNHTLEARVADRERHLAANFARMATLQQQHAAAQERQLIMQEIHDGLGSRLFTSLSRVERGDMATAQVADTLRDCIGDMRLALDALTPGEDDFRVVLGNFLFRWQAQLEDAHVRSAWTIDWPDGAPSPPPQDVLQLLRIAQEALTNVLKHAHATQVRVALRQRGSGLELDVEDDGRTPMPSTARMAGRGLANMQARARQLGGALRVERGRQGTRVLLRVPGPAADSATAAVAPSAPSKHGDAAHAIA